MPISGNSSNYDKQVDLNLDTNANSTTTPITTEGATLAGVYVVSNSGNHTNHIITLQVSPDGVNWFDTEHTITGAGNIHEELCISEELRCKVTTIEGSASTVDITIIIK
jgi:hypothetical protein